MLRQQTKHRYPCRNLDCDSPLCQAWREGYDDGHRDGYREGWAGGYPAGRSDGGRS